jgi:hypothetical protein
VILSQHDGGILYLRDMLRVTTLTVDEIRIVRTWVNGSGKISEQSMLDWLKEHW